MPRKEPQNIEAEINALGCAFLSKSALDKVCEELTSEMFFIESHKKIFEVLRKLRATDTAVDITTVSNELEKDKSLGTIGGIEYLTEIVDSVATPANIEYYINIIFEKYVLRTLIQKSTNIIDSCYEEDSDVNTIVENAEKNILSVNSARMVKEIKPIQELLVESQNKIEYLVKNGGDVTGIPSGFYDLDKKTTGFHENELIIIAARPGMGKTSLALNMATNMAIQSKKSVAFFSLEMGALQIVDRMFASVGQIDSIKLRTGRFDEHTDWKKYNETLSLLADTKMYIDDTPGITVGEIRSKCRRLKNSDKGLDIIIIDYLQLITSSNKYAGQRVNEVSEVSRDLKKLAKELEVPVIALAQLSRGVEAREDKRPLMSDLKESGSIEQDADMVMFIYCDDYYKFKSKDRPTLSPTELIISKNRSGDTGGIDLMFERRFTNFKNYLKSEDNSNE